LAGLLAVGEQSHQLDVYTDKVSVDLEPDDEPVENLGKVRILNVLLPLIYPVYDHERILEDFAIVLIVLIKDCW